MPIQSVINGGLEQEVVFDFDRSLSVGDGLSFDLTYAGAVVGQQTCSFTAAVTDAGITAVIN